MILRLLRADIAPAAATRLIERLRDVVIPGLEGQRGLFGFTCGFRHEAGRTQFLLLSCWADASSISSAPGGELAAPALPDDAAGLLTDPVAEHFELVEPAPSGVMTLDGSVLGVITADVRDYVEANVQNMIRRVRPSVEAAGVVGLYVGRRVLGATTQLVVLALWRDRASLRRWGQSRREGMIDPVFLEQLERWSFETYDCLSPQRLMVPPSGPAVLLADDERRYVDVSSGVEAVIGIPGEFLLRRTIDDLMPPEDRQAVPALWNAFVADGRQEGEIILLRPDGARIPVRFRARANLPEAGLHASVLERPDALPDYRAVEDIVAEAFPTATPA
jgi:PAS domain-containing protein